MKRNWTKLIIFTVTLLGSLVLVSGASAATQWVNNPASCVHTYDGVNCAANIVCGINGVACFNPFSISPPVGAGYSATIYTGSFGAGYVLNCLADRDTNGAPYCDNNAGMWCNASSTCTTYHRNTVCTGGTWADAPGAASCDTSCLAGYHDCNGDSLSCEIHDGDSCLIGGLPGHISGCNGLVGNCVGDPQHFITGVNASYSTTDPLLWGTQYGAGDLINISGNSASSSAFVISNSGQMGVGLTSVSAGAAMEVSSTDKGALLPRLTTTQRNSISSTPDGLIIYNIDSHRFEYYNSASSTWQGMGEGSAGNVYTAGDGLSLAGTEFRVRIDSTLTTSTGVLGLAGGVITAGTYGDSSTALTLTVDTYGRLTGVSTSTFGGGAMVTGTAAAGQVTFWTGTSTISGTSSFVWDNTNSRMGIGTNSPSSSLHIINNTAGVDITVGDPSGVIAVSSTGGSDYYDNGINHNIRVYAYKIIDGQRIYSPGFATLAVDFNDGGASTGNYVIDWSWTPPALGADGYRVLKYNPTAPQNYDYYIDVATSTFTDAGSSMFSLGYTVTPNSLHALQPILTLGSDAANFVNFKTASGSLAIVNDVGNTGVYIEKNGYVGIGTQSALSALTVGGTITPAESLAYNLGASSSRWNEVWSRYYNIGALTWSMSASDNPAKNFFRLTDGANGTGNQVLYAHSGAGYFEFGGTSLPMRADFFVKDSGEGLRLLNSIGNVVSEWHSYYDGVDQYAEFQLYDLGFFGGPTVNLTASTTQNSYILSPLGLGTNAPTAGYQLDVNGAVNLNNELAFSSDPGTAGYVLQSNGTGTAPAWVTTSSLGITGGSSTTPGGGSGSIQFNNSSAFDGTSTLIWDNTNGRLGIGTSTPQKKLSVLTDIIGDGLALYNSNYFLGGFGNAGSDRGIFVLYDATTNTVSLTANGDSFIQGGNFGIGNSGAANLLTVGLGSEFQVNSTGNLVLINNASYSWPGSYSAVSTTILMNDGSGNLTWVDTTTLGIVGGGGIAGSGSNGQVTFWTGASTVSGTPDFYWDNSTERLAIGTSTANDTLSVGGTLGVFKASDNSPRFYVSDTGKVGIGTSTPANKLTVVVSGINDGLGFYNGSKLTAALGTGPLDSSAGSVAVYYDNLQTGYLTATGSVFLQTGNASTSNRFSVSSAGDIVRIRDVQYSWPASQGAIDTVLTNNGSGTLSWTDNALITVNTSTYAFTAGTSTYSETAGTSTYANTAGTSTYAETAGTSTYAYTAGTSTYATTAGSVSSSLTNGAGILSFTYNGASPATVALATTSVTAATYGDASTAVTITVDTYGRITSASTSSIAISASQITSGILPIARGGTNTSTIGAAGSLVYSNGSYYDFTATGTTGYILQANGSGAPTWMSTTSLGLVTGVTGSGTSTQVAFWSSSSALSSSSSLYWDNANGRLGVNSSSPKYALSVVGDSYVSGTLSVANGTVALPGLYFDGDTNTGFYHIGSDSLGVTTNGILRLQVDTSFVSSSLGFLAPDGNASFPTYSFTADQDSGIFRVSSNVLGLSTSGTERMRLTATGEVLINTTTVRARLTVDGDGGIVATGIGDPLGVPAGATLAISGVGSRMMWYPRKAAFRAGYAQSVEFDDSNIGIGSAAFGYGAQAKGDGSFAAGFGSYASGTDAVAFGRGQALGAYSFGMGNNVSANGANSFAFGNNALTEQGDYNIAFGLNTHASGTVAMAFGATSFADGINAIVLGVGSNVHGNYSVAIGPQININANNSFVLNVSNALTPTVSTSSVIALMGGRVGINTTSPPYYLTVAGDLAVTGTIRVGDAMASGTYGQILMSTGTGAAWMSTTSLGLGGGTPAGSNGQVQFNNAGAFGATTTFVWDNVNGRLGIGTTTAAAALLVSATGSDGIFLSNKNTNYNLGGLYSTGNGRGGQFFLNWDNSLTTPTIFFTANPGATSYSWIGTSTSKLGINTTTPEFALTMGNDGGILATGNVGAGATLATAGAGTRMIWYPRKAAFRAGTVGGTQWNDSNIGSSSVAMGDSALAYGQYSVALGHDTSASAESSFAGGYAATVYGSYSFAYGYAAYASGIASFAIGSSTVAGGDYAFAGGNGSSANGISAFAYGDNANAANNYDVALGSNVTANGLYSFAVNVSSTAVTLSQANTIALMGGNVGINTTTPGYPLTVAGIVNISGGLAFNGATGTVGQILQINGSGIPAWSDTSSLGYASSSGSNSYIQNQNIADQSANFRITGTGTLANVIPIGPYTGNMGSYDLGASTTRWNALWAGAVNIGTSTWSLTTGGGGGLGIFDQANGAGNERLTILTGGNVGIGTTSPIAKLSVAAPNGSGIGLYNDVTGELLGGLTSNGSFGTLILMNTSSASIPTLYLNGRDGSINASGTFGAGSNPLYSGAGTRLLWNPKKAAFRAGYVNGTQWDNANIGNYSVAMGYETTASGVGAIAMGFSSTASGDYAYALGYSTVASGANAATALGFMTTASGTYGATALGTHTIASGDNGATALGDTSEASGDYGATAMGYNTIASGNYGATALGYRTTASGSYGATALGYFTIASGNYSTVAGGQFSEASGSSSFVGGGYQNEATGTFSSIGGGDINNAFGDYSFVGGGYFNTANGSSSVVVGGRQNIAGGNLSFVGGGGGSGEFFYYPYSYTEQSNEASGRGSVVTGGTNNTASGLYSFIGGGWANTAAGTSSVALGSGMTVTGDSSFGVNVFPLGGGYTLSQDNTIALMGGNVGIGTTTPDKSLVVQGGFRLYGELADGGGTEDYLCIDTSGLVYNKEGSCTASDRRLKTNISDISGTLDVLNALMQIRGVYYNWDTTVPGMENSGTDRQVGVIAQEIQAVLPELVSTSTGGYLSVDYPKLTSFLIEVSKKQYSMLQPIVGALNVNENSSELTIGSDTTPYNLNLTGELSFLTVNDLQNKLSFSSSTLFESSVSDDPGSRAFTFNAINFGTSTADRYLLSLRSNNNPVFSVSSNGDVHAMGNMYAATAVLGTSTNPGDLAEKVDINPNDTVEAGDVLMVDPNNPDTYTKTTISYEPTVAGVVSTNPTIIVGNGKTSQTAPMAMVGRVPVKVSITNGTIQRGDLLVASDIPGTAMKYDPTKDNSRKIVGIIGIALDNTNEDSKITALIRTGWVYNKTEAAAKLEQQVQIIAAETGIDLDADPADLNVGSGGGVLTYNGGDLNLAGASILNVKSINNPTDKWTVDESGLLIARITTSQGTKNVYGLSSESAELQLSGSAQLVNGEARIIFATDTQEIIDDSAPIKVVPALTSGDCQGIYVSEKSAQGFVVKELNGGTSAATFDWIVVAKRKMILSEENYDTTPASDEEPAIENPPVEQPPSEDTPPADAPPAEEPPADAPPADAPPAEEPAVEAPPAEQPPAEISPAEIPPAE